VSYRWSIGTWARARMRSHVCVRACVCISALDRALKNREWEPLVIIRQRGYSSLKSHSSFYRIASSLHVHRFIFPKKSTCIRSVKGCIAKAMCFVKQTTARHKISNKALTRDVKLRFSNRLYKSEDLNIFFQSILLLHGKNDFAERSKILAGYRKIILLNYPNNYVECSN